MLLVKVYTVNKCMKNLTTTLATNNSKVPPIPPPKPKIYQLQYQHGQTAKFGQLSRSTTEAEETVKTKWSELCSIGIRRVLLETFYNILWQILFHLRRISLKLFAFERESIHCSSIEKSFTVKVRPGREQKSCRHFNNGILVPGQDANIIADKAAIQIAHEKNDFIGGQLLPPPGDSDTDSGICADSDNQLSPRHIISVGFLDNKLKKQQRKVEASVYRKHPAAENAWYDLLMCKRVHPNLLTLSYQRRLPERLQTNCYNSQTSRNGKQYRVRFADQVSSTDGGSSSFSSDWKSSNLVGSSGSNYSNCYLYRSNAEASISAVPMNNSDQILPAFISSSNNDIIELTGQQHAVHNQFSSDYSNHPEAKNQQQINGSYEKDDIASAPLARSSPGFCLAMTRLRRSDDQWLTHANDPPFRLMRRFHNRSTSLPRGIHRQLASSNIRRGSIDCCYPSQDYSSYTQEDEAIINAYLMRSVDNLNIADSLANDTRLGNGRRLPELPPDYAEYDGIIQQPFFGRQRRIRRAGVNGRSLSVGRASRAFDSNMANSYIPSLHRSHLPSVRAQLVALDHRGLRIVLIEKLQPGPFGFYIATGILNQKRGIFISRVSLPSLAPVLSVGDEIIYVEDEFVKGKDLEYVQALIAGKSSVKIVLLPTTGPNAR
ncbi:unnamed protein product [Onchocerca ochengi]|uniref:PDZ domain-containing protein n=1 Tax=Onchocerca ochengi TaxID=42157 RepID=A0A182E915_ONCOC|nr:unnamed protein product [Onchocerca ochengi]